MPLYHPTQSTRSHNNAADDFADAAPLVDKALRSAVGSTFNFGLAGERGRRVLEAANEQLEADGLEIVARGPLYVLQERKDDE